MGSREASRMEVLKKNSNKAVGRMVSVVEQVESILQISQPDPNTQLLYQNAWSYHYLKKKVLTITDANDYKYLDRLLVSRVELGDYGGLYLQAVGNVEGLVGWRDPDMRRRPMQF